MVNTPKNERFPDEEPEYTYCCGTTCDKDKAAWQYEDLNAKVKIADKLVADLLNRIEVLNVTNQALSISQAKYYRWYLDEYSLREKLSVELEVARRDKPA